MPHHGWRLAPGRSGDHPDRSTTDSSRPTADALRPVITSNDGAALDRHTDVERDESRAINRIPQKAYDRTVSLTEPHLERPQRTFLTNNAHVFVALSRDPELRQRDIGYVVGITPGAVQRIIDDLEQAGYLRRENTGRRNRYEVITSEPLRHPLEHDHAIGEILEKLNS